MLAFLQLFFFMRELESLECAINLLRSRMHKSCTMFLLRFWCDWLFKTVLVSVHTVDQHSKLTNRFEWFKYSFISTFRSIRISNWEICSNTFVRIYEFTYHGVHDTRSLWRLSLPVLQNQEMFYAFFYMDFVCLGNYNRKPHWRWGGTNPFESAF